MWLVYILCFFACKKTMQRWFRYTLKAIGEKFPPHTDCKLGDNKRHVPLGDNKRHVPLGDNKRHVPHGENPSYLQQTFHNCFHNV